MEIAIVMVALIAYLGFRQWLRQQRRMMIHRERLAAIEKGLEIPTLEMETRRGGLHVQRILVLAGLTWISLGIGAFVVLAAMLAHPSRLTEEIPQGIQWIAIAPVGIGLAHMIAYIAGRKKES